MEFEPKYLKQGIPGATDLFFVRSTVAKMLLEVAEALPNGYKLKLYDAWRPITVQKSLFEAYYARLCHLYKDSNVSEEDLIKKTLDFVSFPSENPDCAPVHSTGGAVDLTIIDSNGHELNMGTNFDDFSEIAHTVYYENTPFLEIRNNRRLLYYHMTNVGFTNFPTEWWHYDFGDRFWAAEKKADTLYRGIYEISANL